jgi:thiosulfate reductase cytochrome b subunit
MDIVLSRPIYCFANVVKKTSTDLSQTSVSYIEKHSALRRWLHWLNFPILSLMIWSGILIYWANRVYFPHLPDEFFQRLGLDHRLAFGLAVHFSLMWLFILNGMSFCIHLMFSGQWRELVPRARDFPDSISVILHELGIGKGIPPFGKYNAAQRIAYTGIVLAGIGSILTGLVMYKPIQFEDLTTLLGGYETCRLLHYVLMVIYLLFFIVHITQVTRSGWNNFRSMIAGFEIQGKVNDEFTTETKNPA